MQINIGAGKQKMEDFLSLDISEKCNPDIVADIREIPWKWATEPIRYLRADNILEHLDPDQLIAVTNEAHKRMIKDGIFWIRVPLCKPEEPYWDACFRDPTHRSFFTEHTFDYWDDGTGGIPSNGRWQNFGKDYGIVPWKRIRQKVMKPFLIVELQK